MNKRAKITLIAAFAAFAASVYTLAAAAAYQPGVVQPAPSVAVSSADAPAAPEPTNPEAETDEPYRTKIIKLHNGRIAVFEEGSDIPVKLLPTDVSQLPDNAVERLRAGVYAYTAEQYQNYIEDFS